MAKTASYYDALSPEEQAEIDAMFSGDAAPTQAIFKSQPIPAVNKAIAMAKHPAEEGGAIGEMVGNIPRSAMQYAGNFASGIKQLWDDPGGVAKGLGQTIGGVAEKMAGTEIDTPDEFARQQKANALIDHVKNRYGSMEAFRDTLVQDPVGAFADIATVAYPVGKAAQGVGAITKTGALASAGSKIAAAGGAMEPLGVALKGVGKAAQFALPEWLPSKMYQSAVKFSTALPIEQRTKMVRTALDNRIMPTIGGIDKLRQMTKALNDEIMGKIDDATAAGKQIETEGLFKKFAELEDNAKLTGTPTEELSAIADIRTQMRESSPKILTPQQAQKLKQNIYNRLESFYSKNADAPARAEAQMAVAQAAKESLEELFPEIKQLNASEGALIELRKSIMKSAERISNRDLLGLGIPMKGLAGSAATGGSAIGGALGVALGLLDTPLIKSQLAVVLDAMRRNGIKINPNNAAIRLGLVQTGANGEESQEEEQR